MLHLFYLYLVGKFESWVEWTVTRLIFKLPCGKLSFFSLAATYSDRDFEMCGTWQHNDSSRTLEVDLTKGCNKITISANSSKLSIRGSITAQCVNSDVVSLEATGSSSSSFCVFWEPLLDQLMVKLNGKDFLLCKARELQTNCCTHLSPGSQIASSLYGIRNGSVLGDGLNSNVMALYEFQGEKIDCSKFPYSYIWPKFISRSDYFRLINGV